MNKPLLRRTYVARFVLVMLLVVTTVATLSYVIVTHHQLWIRFSVVMHRRPALLALCLAGLLACSSALIRCMRLDRIPYRLRAAVIVSLGGGVLFSTVSIYQLFHEESILYLLVFMLVAFCIPLVVLFLTVFGGKDHESS